MARLDACDRPGARGLLSPAPSGPPACGSVGVAGISMAASAGAFAGGAASATSGTSIGTSAGAVTGCAASAASGTSALRRAQSVTAWRSIHDR